MSIFKFFDSRDKNELLDEYRFDYTKARPNRFALRSPSSSNRDRTQEDTDSDRRQEVVRKPLTM
jgi:hypothetical protein